MQRVFDTIARAAASDAPVLISGESGTGKELSARALHLRGPRAEAPFLTVNCAALPEPLLEAELFGHAAEGRERQGLLLRAGAGTVLLDEIGEMPPSMQVKLLRALQSRTVHPVGSELEVPFEARIVAATHRDLEAEVAAGRFRQDLFFRIHVIEVLLPPLRARGSDVLSLASAFVRRYGLRAGRPDLKLSAAVAERLLRYEWPGNVRELENSIERAVALARGDELALEDLPERVRRGGSSPALGAEPSEEFVTLEEMERRYILRVMGAVGNSKKLAAQVLGLDRSTLYRKLDRYEDE
jgi:two-component system response regulator HydG